VPEKPSSAVMVAWESPGGHVMVLHRDDEDGGILHVTIENGAVTISGENCRYAATDSERERKGKKPASQKKLARFHVTVPLARCQITWDLVE